MSPRYVIADGLGICYWLYGEYWTADIRDAMTFPSKRLAKFDGDRNRLEDYTIQPLPAAQAQAS